jgi:DNA-binding transcriptional regulator YdaS (Cro superfamily)
LGDVSQPAVSQWATNGIPPGRLIQLAPTIERLTNGEFDRRDRWPDKFMLYWPDLAESAKAT